MGTAYSGYGHEMCLVQAAGTAYSGSGIEICLVHAYNGNGKEMFGVCSGNCLQWQWHQDMFGTCSGDCLHNVMMKG